MPSAASQSWLTHSVVLQGEFQTLAGVHLLRSDDGKLLARWYDGHPTVELLDPATVDWPALPLVVPPNLRPAERSDPSRRSSDGTALVWKSNGPSYADHEPFDLGQARVVSDMAREVWDVAGRRLDPDMTRELRTPLELVVSDDRLVAVRRVARGELANARTIPETVRMLKALSEERRRNPTELRELANNPLLRQQVSGMSHGWSPDRTLIATREAGSRVVQIWSVESGELCGSIELTATHDRHMGERIRFSEDNRSLLVTGERVVHGVWDWAESRHLWGRAGVDRPPDTPKLLSADGSLVVSEIFGCKGFTVSSVETDRILVQHQVSRFSMRSFAFSPDGLSLAVREELSHGHATVQIWGPKGVGFSSSSSRRIHPGAVAMLDEITVDLGGEEPEAVSVDTQASAMQWVAILAGEAWTRRPACACPVIAGFVDAINFAIDDQTVAAAHSVRTRVLRPLIQGIIGSKSTIDCEKKRAFFVLDFLAREAGPMALEAIGLHNRATVLRAFAQIVDEQTALRAHPIVQAARDEARRLDPPLAGDALNDGERGEDAAWALGEVESELWWFDREFHDQDFFDKRVSWGEALGANTHWTSNVLRRLAWATSRGDGSMSNVAIFEAAARCVERMLEITDS
jgi:hypothetical protein